ncbi:amidohydrolase [Tahibacter amnicola]|uniref:Amidohydrolase n=1 Tax=Tahibacter amnicola TaxID=2976241 RepID=A0ABY6BLS3_9GAMM|nr:amidohydrolase [Tahibacter amnicola]UXI69995.1 amidohydrolase [Tahibacter amnicola]
MALPTQSLRVSLVQGDTRWHDAAANRAYYGEKIRALKGQTDLIVLPETFTSGFTNETLGNAEGMDGESLRWLAGVAAEVGAVITGSLVIRAEDRCANRLVWMRPDGSFETYDKRHLFRMANEHQRYVSGKDRLIVTLNGWRICPLICYDLRFPVWARNRYNRTVADRFDYDVLIYVANWPSARRYPWQTLLRARAMENLSYCIGVNRVGTDGNQLHYAGDSVALDFLGQPMAELGAVDLTVTVTLDPAALAAHRERFPAWMDADDFALTAD